MLYQSSVEELKAQQEALVGKKLQQPQQNNPKKIADNQLVYVILRNAVVIITNWDDWTIRCLKHMELALGPIR